MKENSKLEDKYTPLKDVAKLIQSQRNLRQISLQYNPEFYYQDEIIDLWNNLMIHTESLVEIVFSGINFGFEVDCFVFSFIGT